MRRIAGYLLYYFFAKYLPRSYELGPIGRLGKLLRRKSAGMLIDSKESDQIFIERGADFGGGKNITLKENACIGENARFMGSGEITIGSHVMMGPDVIIITEDHRMNENGFSGYIGGHVEIGDYAWIGARSIILKGAKIGKNAVVGAGSIVTGELPDDSISCGSPAKVVKYRNSAKAER